MVCKTEDCFSSEAMIAVPTETFWSLVADGQEVGGDEQLAIMYELGTSYIRS